MKLLGNRILVEPFIRNQIGSIILPPTATDLNNTGGPKEWVVIAVGTGRVTKKGVTIPIDWCRPGDRVLCHSYTEGPQPFGNSDKQFTITESQVLAVIPQQHATEETTVEKASQ